MIFQITYPKVYSSGSRYFLQGTVSGRAVQWDISEDDALRLSESVAVAVRRSHEAKAAA